MGDVESGTSKFPTKILLLTENENTEKRQIVNKEGKNIVNYIKYRLKEFIWYWIINKISPEGSSFTLTHSQIFV